MTHHMDTTSIVWVALLVVVGQGVAIAALLKVIRTFGAYTEVVLQTHQQNMLIQQENFNLSDDLARLRAQVIAERSARRPPSNQPPYSEDCVA